MVTLLRPVAGVVLDMDGTLLDTESVYVRSFVDTVGCFGGDLDDGFLHGLIGLPGDEFRAQLRAKLGPGFPYDDHRAAYMVRREELMIDGVPVKAGAVELLDAVAGFGLRLAVATAATRENAERNLQRSGLRARFEIVLTRDDVPRSKPHPDLFLAAAAAIGVPPDACLAVEDSHNGVRAAHAAGMITVMVPDLVPPTAEIAGLCDAVVSDLHAVVELLAQSQR